MIETKRGGGAWGSRVAYLQLTDNQHLVHHSETNQLGREGRQERPSPVAEVLWSEAAEE